tara:strand:- start:833 stop:964 length:132 start_codon:yes stop_codon:yes gene_type:complete
MKNIGASLATFEYKFTPSGLGTIIVVKNLTTGEEENITDFESW